MDPMGDPKTFWLGLKVKSTQGSNHDFGGEFFWILCLPPIYSERICTPLITVYPHADLGAMKSHVSAILSTTLYNYRNHTIPIYLPYVHNHFLFHDF